MNNALLVWSTYLYLVGAFVAYWIIDKSVERRPWIAAFWFVLLPFDILTESLARDDEDDDSNNAGV